MWLDYIVVARARIPHGPKTTWMRAVTLNGRRRTFAGRKLFAAGMGRQTGEEREAVLSLAGPASMMIAATGYTSTKDAKTPKRSTVMQPIGSIAHRVFG